MPLYIHIFIWRLNIKGALTGKIHSSHKDGTKKGGERTLGRKKTMMGELKVGEWVSLLGNLGHQ